MADIDKVPPYPGLVIVDQENQTEYVLLRPRPEVGPDSWVFLTSGGREYLGKVYHADRTRSGKELVIHSKPKLFTYKVINHNMNLNFVNDDDWVLAPPDFEPFDENL